MKHLPIFIAVVLIATGCSQENQSDITASGTIEGTDVNLGSQVSGQVLQVRVDEGTRVAKGDTLVIIDTTDYVLQLQQAEANEASLDASYRLAVEGSRREDVVQAEAAFQTAESNYNRMKDLLASHTVTQQQYDDAYSWYVAAQQNYQKLKDGLRPAEIKGARDRRDAATAQANLLRKKLRDCIITAPTNGTVTLRAVEPGELVGVGTNVLRLTYLDRVKLTIYVSESELGKIKLGDRASVAIDGQKGRSFDGQVTYLSPVAEFTPKNVQTKEERTKLVFGVKIEIDNLEGLLKPGLPADATIHTSATAR